MLIIFGGLPGAGKTTIAKKLAEKIQAVYLRVDTIETAIKNSHDDGYKLVDEGVGYFVAFELAKDNLNLGHKVIADSVNPVAVSRNGWRDVAKSCGKEFLEVEVYCSDESEHKNRIETRKADTKNHKLPTWQQVQDREYEDWDVKGLRLDTAKLTVDKCVEQIVASCGLQVAS